MPGGAVAERADPDSAAPDLLIQLVHDAPSRSLRSQLAAICRVSSSDGYCRPASTKSSNITPAFMCAKRGR
jgi:hypothetical protein